MQASRIGNYGKKGTETGKKVPGGGRKTTPRCQGEMTRATQNTTTGGSDREKNLRREGGGKYEKSKVGPRKSRKEVGYVGAQNPGQPRIGCNARKKLKVHRRS